jgi:hypothetical protein
VFILIRSSPNRLACTLVEAARLRAIAAALHVHTNGGGDHGSYRGTANRILPLRIQLELPDARPAPAFFVSV